MLNNGFLSAGANQIDVIYAAGDNTNGITGFNTSVGNQSTLKRSGNLGSWDQVSATNIHAMGIRDGRLYSWGSNANGRTGLNTTTGNTLTPTLITNPFFTDWDEVNCGWEWTIARRGGRIYSCGNNTSGYTGQNTTVGNTLVLTEITTPAFTDWTKIASGFQHSLALRSTGLIYSWGSNTLFGTAQGIGTGSTNVPTQITSPLFTDWTNISAGGNFSLAIRSTGLLYSWGDGADYRTGQNINTTITTPTQVTNPLFTDWTKINGRFTASGGIRSTGALYTWGNNLLGNTGQGTTVGATQIPTQVTSPSFSDWTELEVAQSCLALRGSGLLYSWGDNANGNTALGTTSGSTNVPTQVSSVAKFRDIAAAFKGSLVIAKA